MMMWKVLTLAAFLFCFNLFGASPSFQQVTGIVQSLAFTNGIYVDGTYSGDGAGLTNISGGSFTNGISTNVGNIYINGILTNPATFIGTSAPVVITGGGGYTNYSQFPYIPQPTNFNLTVLASNNAAGLTNLNATNLVGTEPLSAVNPSVVTNHNVSAVTLTNADNEFTAYDYFSDGGWDAYGNDTNTYIIETGNSSFFFDRTLKNKPTISYTNFGVNYPINFLGIISTSFTGNGSGLTNLTNIAWASITNRPTLGTAAAASTNQFLAAGAGGVYDGSGLTNLNVTNITGQTFYLQTALIMENDFNSGEPPFNGQEFYIPKGGAGNDQINLLLPPISWWGWNGKTNLVLTSTFACTNRAIAEFNLGWYFISSNGIPSSSIINGYWITNTVANTNVMSIVLTQAVNSSTIAISFGHYYIANSATNSIWWIGGTVTAQ
jgi:hypothetical protein